MRTKFFALALALLASTSFAQQSVSKHVTSDTAGTVAMLVKYVGASVSATTDVAVAAGGDMTFRVAGAADTAVNTVAAGSLCGATPGTLDLSSPAATCNSMGEVVDVINASGTWIAVLVDSVRTDLTDNILQTRSVTAGVDARGVPLYIDSSVALYAGGALIPAGCETDIRCFATPNNKLLENPVGGTQTAVRFLEGFSTWNTTNNFVILSVKSSNKAAGSENVLTLFTAAAGATGTNAVAVPLTAAAVVGRPHDKVIVRVVSTSTGSAFTVHATGERSSVN
jgi:hypothetical protein